jgi:hypothetical protein
MRRSKLFAAVALALYAPWALAAALPPQAQVCADPTTLQSGAGFADCSSVTCGPRTSADLTRTVVGPNAEAWVKWSMLGASSQVVDCATGHWTSKQVLGAAEPPVSPTPTPVIASIPSFTVAWTAPSVYTDGQPITAGTPITYNLYGALQGAPKVQVASALAGLSSVQAVPPGTWCYQVTAVVANMESTRSAEGCGVMPVSSAPAPAGTPKVNSVTTATTVYMELQVHDGFSFLAVGTVPLGTPCDSTQRVNDFSVVPASAVTWTGKIQRLAALAACSSP